MQGALGLRRDESLGTVVAMRRQFGSLAGSAKASRDDISEAESMMLW